MSRFCSSCGAQMDEGAVTCPACGKSTLQPAAAGTTTATGGLADNVAGMLADVTIIPPIIFFVLEPYNKNRFFRFHSFPSIFFYFAWIVIFSVLNIVVSI